jgi:hypothetical protein
MSTPAIHAFDQRRPIIVGPSEIRPDDWMEDLGTLRQVDYVDTLGVRTGSDAVHLIHFKHQQGVPDLVRGIPAGAPSMAVWRPLPEQGTGPC